jgi:hypothetical protein
MAFASTYPYVSLVSCCARSTFVFLVWSRSTWQNHYMYNDPFVWQSAGFQFVADYPIKTMGAGACLKLQLHANLCWPCRVGRLNEKQYITPYQLVTLTSTKTRFIRGRYSTVMTSLESHNTHCLWPRWPALDSRKGKEYSAPPCLDQFWGRCYILSRVYGKQVSQEKGAQIWNWPLSIAKGIHIDSVRTTWNCGTLAYPLLPENITVRYICIVGHLHVAVNKIKPSNVALETQKLVPFSLLSVDKICVNKYV